MITKSQNTAPIVPIDLSNHEELEPKILALETKIAELNALCLELNPYEPINEQFKRRLKKHNILEYEDPFKITNSLLVLLEDAIDELHIYRPVDPKEKFR